VAKNYKNDDWFPEEEEFGEEDYPTENDDEDLEEDLEEDSEEDILSTEAEFSDEEDFYE